MKFNRKLPKEYSDFVELSKMIPVSRRLALTPFSLFPKAWDDWEPSYHFEFSHKKSC